MQLDERQICDLEMIMNEGFYPLKGFLVKADYECVLENMRLKSGELWPIPIVLRITKNEWNKISTNILQLKDTNGTHLANLHVEDVYEPDLKKEYECIYGCSDDTHDYIQYVNSIAKNDTLLYLGGTIEKVCDVYHYNFNEYRITPADMKTYFKNNAWNTIVAFQTRNPMHKSHYELTKRSLENVINMSGDKNTKLLIQPVIGVTQECDVPYELRVKCYIKLLKQYDTDSVKLSLLPLSMRMAGPREALWHALIRQNYGCTHFIIGRDHAGPSARKKNGETFFQPYAAHELLESFKDELKIKIIASQMVVYNAAMNEYIIQDENTNLADNNILQISGTKLRNMLRNGEEIPEWFTFPDIAKELQLYYPPSNKQGFCLYFVGLSGCGKTTMSKAIIEKLNEIVSDRQITLLDGDIIREHLGALGFSKADRSLNVRRIGYIAETIVKNRGICVCANIAPYREDREYNRSRIPNYFEIYLSTKIDVCEKRDVKGLYKKARCGQIKCFTGIDDPFEEPTDCEMTFNCESNDMIDTYTNAIVEHLKKCRLI